MIIYININNDVGYSAHRFRYEHYGFGRRISKPNQKQ